MRSQASDGNDFTWWQPGARGAHRVNTDKVEAWEITPLELRRRLDLGDPIVLVDVREAWEADIVSLPGSRLIPLNELQYRADEELDPYDEIVLYSHHGIWSMEAATMLWGLGYENVKSLTGGIDRWSDQVDGEQTRY
jgi:adenylyltransferase/sulfurtransferase